MLAKHLQTPRAPLQERFTFVRSPESERKSPIESHDEKVVEKKVLSLHQGGQLKTRRKVGKAGRSRSRGVPNLPPDISTVFYGRGVFRYATASALTNTTINSAQLVASCGGICTVANSTITSFASSVRLRRVTIWPAQPGTTTAVVPEIVWYGPVPDIQKDESRDKAVPAGYLSAGGATMSTPPRGSLCGDWLIYDGSAINLFGLLNVPTGSILDIEIEFALRNNLAGAGIAVSTATLGTVYYPYLDTSAAKIQPIGRPTTF